MGRLASPWQLLLLAIALSSLQHQQAAAAPVPAPARDLATSAPVLEGVYKKLADASKSSADAAAPASVSLRYRPPTNQPGPGGRWDNFDYQDARNSKPAQYCPRTCRRVGATVARCQCITRASYNAILSGRGNAGECCYLGGGGGGGGSWGSSSGGSSSGGSGPTPPPNPVPPPPRPTLSNTMQMQLYTIGGCSSGGLQVVEQGLKGFFAQLPGVVGSTVQVKVSGTLQPVPASASVVAASVEKSSKYVEQQKQAAQEEGKVTAQFLYFVPKLPPQINPNIVCDLQIEAAFDGPSSAAALAKQLWATTGPCNKIYNNMCGSYYQLERTTACISEPADAPVQFGSCEYISTMTALPDASPSPPPPSTSPPPPQPSTSPPPPQPSTSPPPPSTSPSPPPPSTSPPPPNPSPRPSPSPSPPQPSTSPPPPSASPRPPTPSPSPSPRPPSPSPPNPGESPNPESPSPPPGPSPAPYNDNDKQALLRSLNENPQIKGFVNNGWTPETELCNGVPTAETFWTGVECADPLLLPGIVDKLLLPLGPIPGPLPPSWGDLIQPTVFDLENNFATGTLPENWAKLTILKVLKLNWQRQTFQEATATGLKGQIPSSWSAMVSLETLELAGNAFTGTFPADSWNAMTKLDLFNIDNNLQLQGFLPGTWKDRPFGMTYTVGFNLADGVPIKRGPDNYGLGGATLYTGSGPLYRTKITNWEGLPDNSAINPNPQPNPDPCKNPDPTNPPLICQ